MLSACLRGCCAPAVFHLELPSSASHYAHRAGRTGRMGAPGTVLSLVPASDVWVVRKLGDKLGVAVQVRHPPHAASPGCGVLGVISCV